MDVRQGGKWRFVQRGPDGEYAFNGVYKEVVRPDRLVDTFEFEGMPGHILVETAVFEELDGKTKVTGTALFQTNEDRDMMLKSGMEQGWAETMDRLEDLLQELKGGAQNATDREIAATRIFDTPREQVFDMWTDPEQVARWWGPRGFTTTIHEMDARPGGVFHYRMQSPEGHEMWAKFVYREIVVPERLVLALSFSDKDGNTARSATSPDWPLELLMTATFAESEGRTTLTVQSLPIGATEAEQKAFNTGYEPMQKRWAGTLGQLADYLARA
jgi:uncharacterized protein YndB with AHSA1/START domain